MVWNFSLPLCKESDVQDAGMMNAAVTVDHKANCILLCKMFQDIKSTALLFVINQSLILIVIQIWLLMVCHITNRVAWVETFGAIN